MAYTDKSFFEKIKPYVLEDMKKSGILASLTAAQAFIESNKGNSGLTTKCNNLFGIKGEYKGEYGIFETTEYYNGIAQRVKAKFRKYPSWLESINDHSSLFNRLGRYANLRGCKDYKVACIRVKEDGYATSPTYAQTLINCIEKYKLYEWDQEITGETVKLSSDNMRPTLRKGDQSDYVWHWQKYLNLNGYPCGFEDGKFGSNTEKAVKQFQTAHGLTADGIIGPKTWDAVGNN